MAQSWEVTEQDRENAKKGILTQWEANDIQGFIRNQIEVVASLNAQARFYSNALNKMLTEPEK